MACNRGIMADCVADANSNFRLTFSIQPRLKPMKLYLEYYRKYIACLMCV